MPSAICSARSVKILRRAGQSSASVTVQPRASASGNAPLFGIRATTGRPAAPAKRATRTSSSGRSRALNTIPATRRPVSPSKLRMPRRMLLAAYSDMNSPLVTSRTASAYSRRMGTAKPPQTTSPSTSYSTTS